MKHSQKLSAQEVLRRYQDEDLPDFFEIDLIDVNKRGHSGDTPLCVACIRGNGLEVEALLEGGADMNLAGDVGYTPLHYAASHGHDAIVRRLLEAGADFRSKNDFGETARQVAMLGGYSEIVEILDRWKSE